MITENLLVIMELDKYFQDIGNRLFFGLINQLTVGHKKFSMIYVVYIKENM